MEESGHQSWHNLFTGPWGPLFLDLLTDPLTLQAKYQYLCALLQPLDFFIRTRLKFTTVPVLFVLSCFFCRLDDPFCSSSVLPFHSETSRVMLRLSNLRYYGDERLTLSNVAPVASSSHPKWPLLFPAAAIFRHFLFCIPTCLTALLSINQPLRRIKERLSAFGGQQTHMGPWLQSIDAAV